MQAARARGLDARIVLRRKRRVLHRRQDRPPPGRTLNPAVVNWYTQHAFEPQYEQDDMSKLYPWLFGGEGLYSNIKCEYPCQIIDGVCVCPEE